jgi:multidrug efflux pump subunit AcrA (membrane-fusion protein)
MYATVEIATRVLKDRLLVPREALLVRDQRNLVFRAENGLAKWCYVDVGEQNEQSIEIRSGIAAGDTIIVDGHYTLAHDARIRVTNVEER